MLPNVELKLNSIWIVWRLCCLYAFIFHLYHHANV